VENRGEEKGKQDRAKIGHKCRLKGDSFPSIKNSTWDAGMTRVFGRAGTGDDRCGFGFDFGFEFDF